MAKKKIEEAIQEVSKTYTQPCDLGQDGYIPYWEIGKNGEKKYGYDIYKVVSLCGCGDVWMCEVKNNKGEKSCCLEPNTEIFFSENEVKKAINKIKKIEDPKKLSKWKRRDIFNA